MLVGGTNGKGSVAAMVDAMLLASGLRSGLYTSPHLMRPNERIRIDGVDIATPALHRALVTARAACERGLAEGALSAHPSFFEVMTAAALWAFRERGVDAAVLEVGLGGRLDATNATEPLVSALVTIDLDHVGTLGTTIAAIAAEKAGIIRKGRACVCGVTQADAVAVIRSRCEALGAAFVDARDTPLPPGVRLNLEGAHQIHNARVAGRTFQEFAHAFGLPHDFGVMKRGLESTRWPGRLQLVAGTPPILLDGAHNAAGAEALAAYLRVRGGPKPVLVFAAMADKDIAGILAPLASHVSSVVATAPDVLRAARAAELAIAARELGLSARSEAGPAEALRTARELAGPEGLVLVAGSLYLIGEIQALLEGKPSPGPVSM
jgi:dihydrofolate synthase/folylpolyglutamate synthase